MHPSLRIKASVSLLTILLLSFPMTAFAAETAVITPPVTPIAVPTVETPAVVTPANVPSVMPPQATTTTVIATPATMSQPTPFITLTLKPMLEEHREKQKPLPPFVLQDKLDAYSITIQNNQPNPVLIVSGDIPNRLTSEQAYLKLKHSPLASYGWMAISSVGLAPITMGVSVVLGVLVLGPIAAATTGSGNRKALTYVTQCPGTIPLVTLLPSESKSFAVIMPLHVKPEVHLTVQDLKTQALFTYP
jgi:hypothetical protein